MAGSSLNRPSKRRAASKSMDHGLPDYIESNVQILFVGINPGLRSALVGHHFAGYSNRFWKVLYRSGLVPQPLTYLDDWRLPTWGLGLTNIVARASSGIHELTRVDYDVGRAILLSKIERYRPRVVAILGITLYSILFPERGRGKTCRPGLQREQLVNAAVFLLPNPSGRNAHYSLESMVGAYGELKVFLVRS
jgi:TDG/mug DNA glycosylase family protein